MYIVGLTGGIGSGKSAAAECFIEHGVTVINSDHIAREIVAPGSPALDAIAERFGLRILLEDGCLNRAALRTIIFDSEPERIWLEQLTHPLIVEITHERLQAAQYEEEPPYRILESPLLLETTQKEQVDRILLIDTPNHLQIERVTQRDGNSADQVSKIIESQMQQQKKLAHADDVIMNTGSLEELGKQVETLHSKYCNLSSLDIQH